MPPLTTALTEQLLKPTATIHLGNKLSLIERKVFNAIIWHSQKSRFARRSDSLSLSLLMSLIGLERSRNTEVIQEAVERLVTTPLVWNALRKDRSTDWGICTFLAGAEISAGTLRYVLNPLLIEKINNPTLFAKIRLLVQTQFSSKYSLVLYEYLLDELSRAGSPEPFEVEISLDTLRHVLQFDGPYKHLNNDVLKPCLQEINQYADLTLGYCGVKSGRAVTAIRFAVTRTTFQFRMALDALPAPDPDDTLPSPPPDSLLGALLDKGVARPKAENLITTYDEARIRENLAYAASEHATGKVKNLSAYVVRAIEGDYRPRPTPEARRQEEAAAAVRARQAEQQAEEALARAWQQYRLRRTRERFAALTATEQEARRQTFVARLQRTEPLLYGQYRQTGFSSKFVETRFFSELCDELLIDPAETRLEAFREARAAGATQTQRSGRATSQRRAEAPSASV